MTKRQPAGVPVGGQFAASARPESEAPIPAEGDDLTRIQRLAREAREKADLLTDDANVEVIEKIAGETSDPGWIALAEDEDGDPYFVHIGADGGEDWSSSTSDAISRSLDVLDARRASEAVWDEDRPYREAAGGAIASDDPESPAKDWYSDDRDRVMAFWKLGTS